MAQRADEPFEFNRLTQENQRIIRVSLRALNDGDMKQNLVIRPGDTLMIPGPVIGEYYMAGHVGAPGAYSLNGRQITLRQAIAAARMFDQIGLGGNDRQWMTITMYMYELGWNSQRSFGRAAAVAWILFIVIVVFALLNYYLTSRISSTGSANPNAGKARRTRKGGAR